jgi:hypothetical protein
MLQIAVALLYFTNKVFLSLEKKAGWQIGILASIFAIFYFIQLKLYLLLGLELGFFCILIFGLLNHSGTNANKKVLYILMIGLMALLFVILKNSTWIEFLISTLFILAIYFLANKNWNLGWTLMLIGHVFMAYFTFEQKQTFFASMQVCSIFVALFAIIKKQFYLKRSLRVKM